jgi:hypothetical protein
VNDSDSAAPDRPAPTDLIPLLEEARAELVATLERIPADARDRPPAEGRWSAAQLLEHLATSEASVVKVLNRLERTWREQEAAGAEDEARRPESPGAPDWRSFLRDRTQRVDSPDIVRPAEGVDARQALDHLGRSREALLERVRSIDGAWVHEARFPHPFLGPFTGMEWIEFVARHEQRHARQLAEIAEAFGGREQG